MFNNGLGGEFDGFNGLGGFPTDFLAWQLFSKSGEPGYYMLYNDLKNGNGEKFE